MGKAYFRSERFLLLLVCISFLTLDVWAEPVSINSPNGQGFTFHHQGNCYVLLPQHVHGGSTKLNLTAGAPTRIGAANVIQTFAPSMDLSIGYVTGGLNAQCDFEFDVFPTNVDDVVALDGEVSFITVSAGGRIDRSAGRISKLAYDIIIVDLSPESPDIFKGQSGSIVLSGNTPIGMLIKAKTKRQAIILRMDAIVDRIGRLIVGRGETSATYAIENNESKLQSYPDKFGISGSAAQITYCSSEAANPENNCWSFENGEGPLALIQKSLPFTMEIQLPDTGTNVVRKVGLSTKAENGLEGLPKSIIVERAVGKKERRSWLSFGAADMSPLGQLSLEQQGGIRTSALRITIVDAWVDSDPIRLDSIDIR